MLGNTTYNRWVSLHIIVSGLSHKTAPVEIREALSFPPHKISEALNDLVSRSSINECVILSTCNRTEIYCVANDVEVGKRQIVDFLDACHDLESYDITEHLYFHESVNAVHHLFRVVSSLDSMMVGEAQILGQAKEAYSYAFEADCTNIILNRLFRQAFAVGKRVRTETEIGENAVSISYAAVQLTKKVFDDLTGKTVMIVGAGKMSELTAKHLQANGVAETFITNRSQGRAEKMAREFNGIAIPFEKKLDYMAKSDIVITSTGAPHFIISKEDIQEVLVKRRHQPIFLIDIAVPRDVDPAVNDLASAYLYDIDDLESVVESNINERNKSAKEAEKIITTEVADFLAWRGTLEVVPTIAELRKAAEAIRLAELEKALSRIKGLDDVQMNAVNALTKGIINKLLHEPTVRLKESSRTKDGYLYVESLRQLFGLDQDNDAQKKIEESRAPEAAKAARLGVNI